MLLMLQSIHFRCGDGVSQMSATLEKIDLFIGGEFVPSSLGGYFDNLHPEDDSFLMRVAEANIDDVNRAVLSAHETWNSRYRTSSPAERETWLNNAVEIIERDKASIADDLCLEAGMPITKAILEVQTAIECLKSASTLARKINGQARTSDFSGRVVMSVREPVGVCASICSSSEPFLKAAKLSASALMSGNTVVSLSSEFTPNSPMNLARIYQEAGFPDGAYNQLNGYGEDIGDFLTMHPMVKAVLFHGASDIGKRISEICGQQMKGCVLEFGNKSSAFITRDADLEKAAGSISLVNSRIMCDEKVYKPFVELLKKRVEDIQNNGMGSLKDSETVLGPVLSAERREIVRAQIADAEKKGATLIAGGHWMGNRCQPTILADVTPEMSVCRSETFGPVVAIYRVKDFEEGLSLANDIDFSLSSSIWTTNINQAMEYSRRSQSARAYVNTVSCSDSSFGSGDTVTDINEFGRSNESVARDIEQLTNLKSVSLQLPNNFDAKKSAALYG